MKNKTFKLKLNVLINIIYVNFESNFQFNVYLTSQQLQVLIQVLIILDLNSKLFIRVQIRIFLGSIIQIKFTNLSLIYQQQFLKLMYYSSKYNVKYKIIEFIYLYKFELEMLRHNQSSSQQQDDSDYDNQQYKNNIQRFNQLKLLQEQKNRKKYHYEEDQEITRLKPKLPLEQPIKKSALLKESKSTPKLKSRPITAYTVTLKKVNTKVKLNDPVNRYQQMSQAWKKDKFLTGGANKKQGRKLQLQKRNKQYDPKFLS